MSVLAGPAGAAEHAPIYVYRDGAWRVSCECGASDGIAHPRMVDAETSWSGHRQATTVQVHP